MLKVTNFEYNGFMGKVLEGHAPYTAKFKKWTADPGVAVFICSDDKERIIPTFAIEGKLPDCTPKQAKTGVMFGAACKS